MEIHWPLVVSTTCQRVGFGTFICAFAAHVILGTEVPLNIVALCALVLLAFGGLASMLHLQRPQRFFNAFSNMKSHLTQEALITPFAGIALLACGLNGFLYDLGSFSIMLAGLAALLSLAFLVATGFAYQMGSRPAWNTGFVVALFLLTSFAAGSIATLFAALALGDASFEVLVAVAGVLSGACVAVQIAYLVRMSQVGYGVDVHVLEQPYRTTFVAWFFCGAILPFSGFAGCLVSGSPIWALIALASFSAGIAAWTILFFKGARKAKMFSMYSVDLTCDM